MPPGHHCRAPPEPNLISHAAAIGGVHPNYSPNPFGDQPRNNFSLTGNADGTEISTSNIGIFDTATGVFSGFFNAVFSGSWNLPTYNSGGATQVPEPGMLTLFAAGALVPVLRRRKAKREGK